MFDFCIIQGEIVKVNMYTGSAKIVFGLGDKIHESIRLYNTVPLFLKQHISDMKDTMDMLHFAYPDGFTQENISKQITRLLNVNKVYKGGQCKLIVYRNADVFDRLEVQKSFYAIFIEALPQLEFEFNSIGKKLALLQSAVIEKPHLYSMYSAHMIVQNKVHAILKKTQMDALAFFNSNGSIFHTSGGDLFYVKGNEIRFAAIEENTFQHPLTFYIIKLLHAAKYSLAEKRVVTPDDVLNSDEIFLVHPIKGIQWVVHCNEKTYSYMLSRKINMLLHEDLKRNFS